MKSYLATLTAYNNRYYKSTTGQQASDWILKTVKSVISGHPDATATAFSHSWLQSSIVVKIPGKNATNPTTILGAHMDSINLNSPTNGRAPGGSIKRFSPDTRTNVK
jgi:leucyl aminopeptidase